MKNIRTISGKSLCALTLVASIATIGCGNVAENVNEAGKDSSVEAVSTATTISSETIILAADRNNDGKYDIFDSNNDGVLDVEEDALLSLDTGIDYPDVYLPEFELTDENGITYDLDTIKSKDLTIICVWAYWCPDCFWELYGMTHSQDEDGNVYSYFDQIPDNIQWISLTTSGPDDYNMWSQSVHDISTYLHLPFSHIIDGSDEANAFVSSFRTLVTEERDYTNTVPCVAIVDSNGYVLEVLYEQDAVTTIAEIEKYLTK